MKVSCHISEAYPFYSISKFLPEYDREEWGIEISWWTFLWIKLGMLYFENIQKYLEKQGGE